MEIILSDFMPGDKVHYKFLHTTYGHKFMNGIVKSVVDSDVAFVVFACGEDWANYQNYTGNRVMTNVLYKGWEE